MGEYFLGEALGSRVGGFWISEQQFCEKAERRKLYSTNNMMLTNNNTNNNKSMKYLDGV